MELPTATSQAGEVIESSTTLFVAQCPSLHDPPAFGSFVKVGGTGSASTDDPFTAPQLVDGTVFAVVCDVRTSGLDAGRRPVALGVPPERLQREQPQVFELLRTEFTALIIAHASAGRILHVLPPHPPHIHDFVVCCGSGEVRALTSDPSFVRPLLSSTTGAAPDEFAAAALRIAAEAQSAPAEYLLAAGKVVAIELADDFRRADTILRKLNP